MSFFRLNADFVTAPGFPLGQSLKAVLQRARRDNILPPTTQASTPSPSWQSRPSPSSSMSNPPHSLTAQDTNVGIIEDSGAGLDVLYAEKLFGIDSAQWKQDSNWPYVRIVPQCHRAPLVLMWLSDHGPYQYRRMEHRYVDEFFDLVSIASLGCVWRMCGSDFKQC